MKTILLTVRVTQDEMTALRDKAAAKRCANVSDYTRLRLGLDRKRARVGAPTKPNGNETKHT